MAPLATNTELKEIIYQTSDDLGDVGYDKYFGHGRLNIGKAAQAAVDLQAQKEKDQISSQ